MAIAVTTMGQVTLPEKVGEAAGIKPGDRVEVRATASGGVYIEKPHISDNYAAKLEAVARRYPITGATTDEIMRELRGDA